MQNQYNIVNGYISKKLNIQSIHVHDYWQMVQAIQSVYTEPSTAYEMHINLHFFL